MMQKRSFGKLFVRSIYAAIIIGGLGLFFFIRETFLHTDSKQRTIKVLTWIDTIDIDILHQFEEKYNAKVIITYIDSNEELFVKLSMHTKHGYDLVMVSDYLVPKLINRNLVKPLDKKRCTVFDTLLPQLLHKSFDPDNTYSIPYCWTLYGLGINTSGLDPVTIEKIHHWQDLFVPQIGNVGMVNIAREAFVIGSLALFKEVKKVSMIELTALYALLKKQKSFVESYIDADFRANSLLLSQQVVLSVVTSANIAKLVKSNPELIFRIPDEGPIMLIDSFLLPVQTQQDALVYDFLQYLYSPEIVAHHMKQYPIISASKYVEEVMNQLDYDHQFIQEHLHYDKKINFFVDIADESLIHAFWLLLKAK